MPDSGSIRILIAEDDDNARALLVELLNTMGHVVVAEVRERWPSIRIGIVTGWEPGAGAGAGGDFILRKPVRTSELLAQVAADR